jgi:molybdopterin converting factor subunit 1
MTAMMMQIRVLFFASCRDLVGSGELELTVRKGITVGEFKEQIVKTFPQMAGITPSLSTAVNMEYARDEEILNSKDEVALIPPVSGGGPVDEALSQ